MSEAMSSCRVAISEALRWYCSPQICEPLVTSTISVSTLSVSPCCVRRPTITAPTLDRKSTRLNSSHQIISYAVFCLKKKKQHLSKKHDCITSRQSRHQQRGRVVKSY